MALGVVPNVDPSAGRPLWSEAGLLYRQWALDKATWTRDGPISDPRRFVAVAGTIFLIQAAEQSRCAHDNSHRHHHSMTQSPSALAWFARLYSGGLTLCL